jgi:hypothetical protein
VPVAAAALAGLAASALAVAAAPALMPASYSWITNTTSESAAQGITGAWLARVGFVLFGLAVTALAVRCPPAWGAWASVLHYAFGAFMICAAAFATRPWTGQVFDRTEDALHSAAATAMGFAFAIGVAAAAIHQRRRTVGALLLDAVAVTASIVVPLVMLAAPGVDGATQRLIFAIAYLWYACAAVSILRSQRPSPSDSHRPTGQAHPQTRNRAAMTTGSR